MTGRDNPKPGWWEDAKTRSLEHKAAIKRQSQLAQPGDAFLVVTEGTLTEPVYFGRQQGTDAWVKPNSNRQSGRPLRPRLRRTS
jgi:hypothetical protein